MRAAMQVQCKRTSATGEGKTSGMSVGCLVSMEMKRRTVTIHKQAYALQLSARLMGDAQSEENAAELKLPQSNRLSGSALQ